MEFQAQRSTSLSLGFWIGVLPQPPKVGGTIAPNLSKAIVLHSFGVQVGFRVLGFGVSGFGLRVGSETLELT